MGFSILPKKDDIPSPKNRRNRIMTFVLFFLVLVILGVVYYYFDPFEASYVNPEGIFLESNKSQINEVKSASQRIDFDQIFLKNSLFKSLRSYGEWPLEIGEKGRANPFVPYGG